MPRTGHAAAMLAASMLGLLAPSAAGHSTYRVVYAFAGGEDGDEPISIVADKAGDIYGVTFMGGSSSNCTGNCGTIFKITPGGTKTTLHSFTGAPGDASEPVALTIDKHGNLYGAGVDGGLHNFGSVFKLATGGTETLLYSFDANALQNGIYPSGLVAGADGNLYGMTQSGGNPNCANGCGTVFKLTPKGKLTVLHAFAGHTEGDGEQPMGGLTIGPDGTLYGTTLYGGANGYGTVFKVDPASVTETVLHAFTRKQKDGAHPTAPPVLDAAGNLYGGTMESSGDHCAGRGCGMLYKIAPDGTYTMLYYFDSGNEGSGGHFFGVGGALYVSNSGDIFGTTMQGGAYKTCDPLWGCGAVFELTAGGEIRTLYAFQGTANADGETPQFGLIPNPALDRKALYGVTAFGGNCDHACGTVFEVTK